MKKRLFAAIVVMACLAVSCQKNEEELPTFEAKIESGSAKTELVGSIIQWVSGDQVKVFGDFGYAIYDVTPRGDNPTWATLVPSYNYGLTGMLPYRFVYPAENAIGGTTQNDNNNTLYVDYPQNRLLSDAPMKHFAMYGENDHHDVSFINLGGMLKIHMQQEGKIVKKIYIIANENIAGLYAINTESTDAPLTGGQSKKIVIGGNVDISEGYDLYVSIPAGTYSGMGIMLIDNEGKYCQVTNNSGNNVNIERSVITSINISNQTWVQSPATYTTNGNTYQTPVAVDLGLPSGTLWASCDIGAANSSSEGLKFKWGELAPSTYSDPYRFANNTKYNNSDNLTELEECDDAAVQILGYGWKMPTKEQFEELWNSCTINGLYSNCLTLTGPNGNSITMYQESEEVWAGYFVNCGYRLSSNLGTSIDQSYCLHTGGGYAHSEEEIGIMEYTRGSLMYIRPVK